MESVGKLELDRGWPLLLPEPSRPKVYGQVPRGRLTRANTNELIISCTTQVLLNTADLQPQLTWAALQQSAAEGPTMASLPISALWGVGSCSSKLGLLDRVTRGRA